MQIQLPPKIIITPFEPEAVPPPVMQFGGQPSSHHSSASHHTTSKETAAPNPQFSITGRSKPRRHISRPSLLKLFLLGSVLYVFALAARSEPPQGPKSCIKHHDLDFVEKVEAAFKARNLTFAKATAATKCEGEGEGEDEGEGEQEQPPDREFPFGTLLGNTPFPESWTLEGMAKEVKDWFEDRMRRTLWVLALLIGATLGAFGVGVYHPPVPGCPAIPYRPREECGKKNCRDKCNGKKQDCKDDQEQQEDDGSWASWFSKSVGAIKELPGKWAQGWGWKSATDEEQAPSGNECEKEEPRRKRKCGKCGKCGKRRQRKGTVLGDGQNESAGWIEAVEEAVWPGHHEQRTVRR